MKVIVLKEKEEVRFSVECKENDCSDENSRFEKVVCILFVRDCDLVVELLKKQLYN